MVGFSSPATAGMSETPFRHNMSAFFFSLAIAFGTFQYNLDTSACSAAVAEVSRNRTDFAGSAQLSSTDCRLVRVRRSPTRFLVFED
jgi:hypothetical protein